MLRLIDHSIVYLTKKNWVLVQRRLRGKGDTDTGSGSCWRVWWPMWLRQIMWTLSPDKTFTCCHMPSCWLCSSRLTWPVYCELKESRNEETHQTLFSSNMDPERRWNSQGNLASQIKQECFSWVQKLEITQLWVIMKWRPFGLLFQATHTTGGRDDWRRRPITFILLKPPCRYSVPPQFTTQEH